MPLTRSNCPFFDIKHIFLLALLPIAIVETACANSAAQEAGRRGPSQSGTPVVIGPVVTVNGATADDRDVVITLNPCQGETPGNVLGVSEQAETPRKVTAFVSKLRDPDPKVRACAARQLGYLGAEAKDALPHVIRRMREEEHSGVSVNLSEAFWAIGPDTKSTVDEWLKSLRDDDAEVRYYAAFALGFYKPLPSRQKEVGAALAAATRDKDGGVRWMAVRGLVRLGPSAADAVPDLLAILLDEKSPLRSLAALALGNIGPQAEVAAPDLLKVVYTTKDSNLYTFASIALGRIGPAVVPLLAKDLKSNKILLILDVLQNLAPNGAPLVVEALRMNDKQVRGKALDIIWRFGPAAEPAVPLLVKELKDDDKDLRFKATAALKYLGPVAKAAAPALMVALDDKDDFVQCYVAEALGALGPEGAPAVPKLLRLMSLPVEGERDRPQRCAAEALMQMGPETKALVPPEMVRRVTEYNAWLKSMGPKIGDEDDPTRPKPKAKKATAPSDW